MSIKEKPSKEQFKSWSSDPKNWKLSIFYYNKEDKRILPPKRTPILGWTVNFANPKSYFLLILLIVFLLVMKYISPNTLAK